MVINENNSYINSFSKGMNSDITYDQIQKELYVYAKNVRITKNLLLGGANEYSTLHEGIIAPVYSGVLTDWDVNDTPNVVSTKPEILAVDSVERLCTIVTREEQNLCVYRLEIDEESNKITYAQLIWTAKDYWSDEDWHQVSTVLYKELDNVVKLYIATGKDPVISLRVDDWGVEHILKGKDGQDTPVDFLINNRRMPENRVFIDSVISGRLKTQLVLYTYRYYNKYLNTTQLAPLTNKILVIDPSRHKENGNAEDTETSIGFTLTVDTTGFDNWYDRILIFRLSYIHPGEDAEVALIYDDDIKAKQNVFSLNDVGIEPLKSLTMEEFAAMSGIIIIPQAIAQNQSYMFGANIEDDTIIRGIELSKSFDPKHNNINTITAEIQLSKYTSGKIPIWDSNVHFDNFADTDIPVSKYLIQRGINPDIVYNNYNNIFTSSLLRSLRRGETYRYGIVFYDNKGRRSDVLDLGDVAVKEISFETNNMDLPFRTVDHPDIVGWLDDPNGSSYYGGATPRPPFDPNNTENLTPAYTGENRVYAKALGISFDIPDIILDGTATIKKSDIIGCQIVRRSSKDIYQKTLLQVALSRPISQGLSEVTDQLEPNKYSPFYPSGFLAVNDINIFPTYYSNNTIWSHKYDSSTDNLHASTRNTSLFLIFSAEIDFRRDDVLSRLNISDTSLKEIFYLDGEYKRYTNAGIDNSLSVVLSGNIAPLLDSENKSPFRGMSFNETPTAAYHSNSVNINRIYTEKLNANLKQNRSFIFNYFGNYKDGILYTSDDLHDECGIKSIRDVKIPEWNSAFVEIQFKDDGSARNAIKKYKQYNTSVDKYTYNNFASFNKYDFKPGDEDEVNQPNARELTQQELITNYDHFVEWAGEPGQGFLLLNNLDNDIGLSIRNGYIGAGTSCFLIVTDKEMGQYDTKMPALATCICNIQHPIKFDEVESDEQIQYFGFGNYFKLKTNANNELVLEDGSKKVIVFDGDIYITPHEFTTMHKVYNFESVDTLQSTQITNYVPLESKVNTYFDYGMNLLNTESANLLYEPGSIDGVTTQERPLHQYNMVYSDNDASNDVFTLISTDKNETNKFKQRAYYSEPKVNGEFIDNFLIFKAVAFIDVDSTYGLITNLHSDKNNLYYWQDHAFGKFSVNERSLINDTNGNTIMLGQAGILSRYDYLSTQFGMRLYDFCSRSTESGLYWVDINNKAVVAADGGKVVNYGEYVGVQNIINNNLTSDKDVPPQVDYDLQNNELLCKCFGQDQLIFNVKYNMATSIYTRRYKAMAYVKNHTFGIDIANRKFVIHKHNYIDYNKDLKSFLSPMQLWFIVNPIASVTKVYDSLQIVPIKRSGYLPAAFTGSKLTFDTDIYNPTTITLKDRYTDREGNLIYNVPRLDNVEYGNRIRGKWMLVKFNNNNPTQYVTLSHVITKYRQSFS